ncbi:hypothetical protein RS83_02263 [Microbacterium oxydans]|uniref:Uncharacterized protein n=1 Tax=Microbacterium oxydans TaxID=82380 RepID=A0A0F0L6I7_9MICO|nr:hypothetical protein RS83_02263 [Microbacterium oxydans]
MLLLSLALPLLASEPDAPSLSWADKLTALGTVGAVLATLVITLTTYFRDRRSRREEARERAQLLLKQQALQVHWWLEPCPDHLLAWDDDEHLAALLLGRRLDECWGTRLVLENRSELPIHEVTPVMTLKIILKPQFGNWSIGPGGRYAFHLAGEGECLLDLIGTPRPSLLFRDHVGRAWRRGESGSLAAIEDDADLSDEMISMSSAAYRALHENRRSELEDARERDGIREVIVPLVRAGLDSVSLDDLTPGDDVAFELLQRSHRQRTSHRVAKEWWSWRARRQPVEKLAESLRYFGLSKEG